MPYASSPATLMRSACLLALLLTLTATLSCPANAVGQRSHSDWSSKEPFRDQGSDMHRLFYTPSETLYRAREQLIHALELRLTQPPSAIDNLAATEAHQLQQYRDAILQSALNNRHWLMGIGTDAIEGARMFAALLLQEFTQVSHRLIDTTTMADGHLHALAALSLTDETLHILQLIQAHLPEANLGLLYPQLDRGLKAIQTIIKSAIPSAHYNGLVTPALIRLNATLERVLSQRTNARRSVHKLEELRTEIDAVLTSFHTHSYYPTVDIDPQTMIDSSHGVTPSAKVQCFQWPWPVPESARNTRYLICTDQAEGESGAKE